MSRETSDAGNLKGINLPQDVYNELVETCDQRGLSISEGLLDLMELYLRGQAEEPRLRQTRRVTFWVPNERLDMHKKFTVRVKRDGTTLAGAVEAAMKGMKWKRPHAS